MQIPYETTARPDTGLYNAKLGIWLFLASEVMLFGGLFSAYIFLRMGADPGYWPHGLLNVPVGMGNTFILIASSVTVVLAWAALKMRQWTRYYFYMLATIVCGIIFLTVKLSYEWPQKFVHFGVFIKKEALSKYEPYLGNEFLEKNNREARVEITGHVLYAPENSGYAEAAKENREEFEHENPGKKLEAPKDDKNYVVWLDEVNADPTSPKNERPAFFSRPLSEKVAEIAADDIVPGGATAFYPRHSSYFSTYFLITGLHGLHVLGGVIVFIYFLLFGKKLYMRNPEHMANRVEVAGLFWHFVDLVWIFVFPIFYLL